MLLARKDIKGKVQNIVITDEKMVLVEVEVEVEVEFI